MNINLKPFKIINETGWNFFRNPEAWRFFQPGQIGIFLTDLQPYLPNIYQFRVLINDKEYWSQIDITRQPFEECFKLI